MLRKRVTNQDSVIADLVALVAEDFASIGMMSADFMSQVDAVRRGG